MHQVREIKVFDVLITRMLEMVLRKIIAGTIFIHMEVSHLINRMFFANNSITYEQL